MRKYVVAFLSLVVLIGAGAFYQLRRPLPPLNVTAAVPATARVPGTLNIAWPIEGSAAIEVAGVGLMGESSGNQVWPLASVAKLMTAYLTLQHHPLDAFADGPTVTITAQDVADYQANRAQHNSVAQVALGEQLTERQLLEALLLPSGDNIATLLARWDAGSVAQFVQEMNQTAQKLGMTHTHYADPAGVDPGTAGSALDQLKIAQADMAYPALREIVALPQARLPVGPTVYNTDYVLGQSGIVGVKTGSMSQVGGNFVFATQPWVNGKQVMVIGCVMAQHGDQPLMVALHQGVTLAQQAASQLEEVSLIKRGAPVALLSAAWKQSSALTASKDLTSIAWPGFSVHQSLDPLPLGPSVNPNTTIGQLTIQAGDQTAHIPLQTAGTITLPTLSWKLTRGML